MSQDLSTQSAACFPQSLTCQCNPFTPTQSQHNPSGRFSVRIIELETGSHHSGRNPQSYCNPYAIIESNYNRRTRTAGEYRTRRETWPSSFSNCVRIVQGSVKIPRKGQKQQLENGIRKSLLCVQTVLQYAQLAPFEDRDHKHMWYTTWLLGQQIKQQQNTNEIHAILMQSQNPSAIHNPSYNPPATQAEELA